MERTCLRVIGVVILYSLATVTAQNDPTNVACSVLSSSSIQLSWTQPTNTAINGYHLSVDRIDGIVTGTTIPSVVLSSYTYVSYTYSGLGNYAQYNLTIHSYIGSTNYTDVSTTCRTSEDAPNGAPYNFNCTAISTSEITCVWDALDQAYWNGILIGYRIQWLGSNTSALYSANVSDTVYTYAVTGLAYDTQHIFLLSAFTSVNYGTVYSTDVESTHGATTTPVENATRYYCNEAVPGVLEFSWEEMPCTIYAGTIGGLMLLSLLLLTIMCCHACCCQKSGGGGVSINMIGGSSRGHTRSSSRQSGDDEDTGSTTETDDDEDISDNDHVGEAESDKPGSNMGTPSLATPADLELSDSDYDSDTDDDMGAPPTTSNSTANQKRDINLKTFSKTKILTAHIPVEQDTKLAFANELEATGGTNKEAKSDDDESGSVYEDWDPDTLNKTNNSENDKVDILGNMKAGKMTLGVGHGNKKRKSSTVGKGIKTSTNDDDDLIERTASVSSIFVDTQENVYDSVWSPDITDQNRFDKSSGNPVHNNIFRTNSTFGMKNTSFINEDIGVDNPKTTNSKTKFSIAGTFDDKNGIFVNSVSYDTEETSDTMDPINLGDEPIRWNKHGEITPRNMKSAEMMKGTPPAWLSNRQRDKLRKTSNTTPVEHVDIKHAPTVIDIEPILGSDRLGKRFPFLNLEASNQGQESNKAMASPTSAWGGQPNKKSNITSFGVKTKQKRSIADTAITVVNDSTLSGEGHSDGKEDTDKAKAKDNAQIFYGFGLGRFRKTAANWLNKMRMKKQNVKLANSKWD